MANVTQTVSAPRGQIHVEGGQLNPLNLMGSGGHRELMGVGRSRGRAGLTHTSTTMRVGTLRAKELRVGALSTGKTTLGQVGVWCLQRDGATRKSDPFGVGAQHIVDHTAGTTVYQGMLSERPSLPTSRAVYFDDGGGPNAAGWYFTTDAGSTWNLA